MTGEWKLVGRVTRICRYPLKGAAGEEVPSSKVGWHGLAHDRRFALLRMADVSGLPWASPRQFPQLLSWRASVPPASTALRITTTREWVLDPKDAPGRAEFARHASKILGETMTLIQMWSGAFDSMPVSVMTGATMESAASLVGASSLDPRRFRPNIMVETEQPGPWPESQWLGRELRFGDGDSAVLRVDRHITRCEVIDRPPECGEDNGLEVFKAIRDANRNRAGVYATPRHVGQISVGMTAWIR